MSLEHLPVDNLDEFIAARHHPMTPDGQSIIVQVDRVGQQFQAFRVANGLTQKQVSGELDWSQSKMIRLEAGYVRPDVADARVLLDLYNVDDMDVANALIENVRANRAASTSTPYDPILSQARKHYLGYEGVAGRVGLYEPIAVPDILQTAEYAAALDTVFYPSRGADEQELAARLRHERAAYLLGKYGPPLRVVIDEAVLRRPEGGPDPSGERDQYTQLRKIIDGLRALNTVERTLSPGSELNPDIAIQIAPFSSGSHSLSTRPHGVLRMDDQPHAAVYIQSLYGEGETFIANPGEPTTQQRTFEKLLGTLPGPERTNGILDAILASLPS